MIAAVIADDLTGAAELASAAADLGFSSEVHTAFDPSSQAEVICLDTNSRLLPADQAEDVVSRATAALVQSHPDWLYKKTDSVLRGNVRTEIDSIVRTTRLENSLLVPANPSKSRVIRHGTYYVNGVPLAQTDFAQDPHHPRTSSDVRTLLGSRNIPDAPIQTPDVTTSSDLIHLAATLTPRTLAAGGVDFFRAVLLHRTTPRPAPTTATPVSPPVLFCCGSLQGWCTNSCQEFGQHGIPVVPMTEVLRIPTPTSDHALEQWGGHVRNLLDHHPAAALTLGDSCPTLPDILTTRLAQVVSYLLAETNVSTLVIEGGSTASAILGSLRFTRLQAFPAPALPGVAALRPAHPRRPLILLKPGSYPWPPEIWKLTVSG